jgi:YVTN family beta-propeller protein
VTDELAYIAGRQGASPASGIVVVDTVTALQTTTFDAGTAYNYCYITPDGSKLYALRNAAAQIDVLDATTGALLIGISVVNATAVMSNDGTKLYVADGVSTVSIIDTSTDAVTATITLANIGNDYLGITPDDSTLMVASSSALSTGGIVTVIATATNTVTGTITLPAYAGATTRVVAHTNTVAYVGDFAHQKIYVLDLVGLVRTATIAVSSQPDSEGIILSVDGAHIYSIGFGTILSVVSTASDTEVSTHSVGAGECVGMDVTPDGATIVASDYVAFAAYLIDTTSFAVTTVTTSSQGQGIAIHPAPPATGPFIVMIV